MLVPAQMTNMSSPKLSDTTGPSNLDCILPTVDSGECCVWGSSARAA